MNQITSLVQTKTYPSEEMEKKLLSLKKGKKVGVSHVRGLVMYN